MFFCVFICKLMFLTSMVLGKGFRIRRIELHYFRFDKIQDGGWRPSWNDGAVTRNPCVSWAFLFVNSIKSYI